MEARRAKIRVRACREHKCSIGGEGVSDPITEAVHRHHPTEGAERPQGPSSDGRKHRRQRNLRASHVKGLRSRW
eukprot:scaffold49658_cov30-Tisochrysis_lutea.AAC.2